MKKRIASVLLGIIFTVSVQASWQNNLVDNISGESAGPSGPSGHPIIPPRPRSKS